MNESEAKLTALLLGELSAEEAATVRASLEHDAAMAQLHERLARTVDLVRQAVKSPVPGANAPTEAPRLSEDRRQRLLQTFRTVTPKEWATPKSRETPWFIPMGIAAALVVLIGLAGLWPGFQDWSPSATLALAHNRSSHAATAQNGLIEYERAVGRDVAALPSFAPSPPSAPAEAQGARGPGVDVPSGLQAQIQKGINGLPALEQRQKSDTMGTELRRRLSTSFGRSPTLGVPPPAQKPALQQEAKPSANLGSATLSVPDLSQVTLMGDPENRKVIAWGDFDNDAGELFFNNAGNGKFVPDAKNGPASAKPDVPSFYFDTSSATGPTSGSDVARLKEVTATPGPDVVRLNEGTATSAQDKIPTLGDMPVLGRVFMRADNSGIPQPRPVEGGQLAAGFGGGGLGGGIGGGGISGGAFDRTHQVTEARSELPKQNVEVRQSGGDFLQYELKDQLTADLAAETETLEPKQETLSKAKDDSAKIEDARRNLMEGVPVSSAAPGSQTVAETLQDMFAVRPQQSERDSKKDGAVNGVADLGPMKPATDFERRSGLAATDRNAALGIVANSLEETTTPTANLPQTVRQLDREPASGAKLIERSWNPQTIRRSEGEAAPASGEKEKRIAFAKRETEQLAQKAAGKDSISVVEPTPTSSEQLDLKAGAADLRSDRPATSPAIPQPEIQTLDNPFSTFSLNVSDVSFKLAAASLEKGQMPEPATVRSEEFINAFEYRDPEPAAGAPIGFAWERARSPFAQDRDLLRFSIRTAAEGRQAGRPLNIVLLLDKSGSMERADRVRIVREALRVLAGQLQAQDKLSVITFARRARLVADGVPGNQAGQVTEQVSNITPEGGTNLEDALNLAYQTALKQFLQGGINRVVLLTDGAANLGDVDPDALKQKVEAHRKQGIALDCFGIGWEGFNDDLLEVLSSNGDGRYGFLNTPEEATSGFANQLTGALHVAAADVKVQVEFNPHRVTVHRQIGYAKHQLTQQQFRDNTVDAAEIGAAESGNALYVLRVDPQGQGDLATVRVRYKTPGTAEYHEQEWAVPYTGNAPALEQASPAMRLIATASAFSEWLASSPYAAEVKPDRLLGCLNGVPVVYGSDPRPRKLEWMIRQAKSLSGQ